jgi:hypothetical protein
MTILEIATLIIAAAGLAIGGITFYRQFLFSRQSLLLVGLNSLLSGQHHADAEFALINNGTKEVMLIRAEVNFGTKDSSARTTPGALKKIDGDSNLLKPDTGTRFQVRFVTPFSPGFAKNGQKVKDGNGVVVVPMLFLHFMFIQIVWVEMNGKTHQAEIPFTHWVFSEDGKVVQKALPSKSFNLYARAFKKK